MNAAQRHAIQQRSDDAAGFRAVLQEFGQAIALAGPEMLEDAAHEVYGSIVFGSTLTAAPGQPVLSGRLRDSWKMRHEGGGAISVTTDSPYGRVVEHNFRRLGRLQRREVRDVLKSAGLKPRLTKRVLKEARRQLGGLRFRSGGPHSVALTQKAWPRIAQAVARRYGWDLIVG